MSQSKHSTAKRQHNTRGRKHLKQGSGLGPVPALPPRVQHTLEGYGLGIDSLSLDAMAEYRRKDETEIVVPEASILTQLSDTGVMNGRRAFYVHWLVPSRENSRGTVLSVDRFTCAFFNAGAFDVEIVALQPHGYERSPSAIAAWVPLASRTVKSGSTMSLDIRPVSNENVVPLRGVLAGADCVIPVAFSLARQGLSAAGPDVPVTEVGVRISVAAFYKASGNVVQSGKFFGLRSYTSDESLFITDATPPIPVPVGKVAPGIERVVVVGKTLTIGEEEVTVFALKGITSDAEVHGRDFDGLDKSHVYVLPEPLFGVSKDGVATLGTFVRYINDDVSWVAVRTFTTPPDVVGPGNGESLPDDRGCPDYHKSQFLVPLAKTSFTTLPVTNHKALPPCVSPRLLPANLSASQLGTWVDDALEAVSFVVGVVKVAAAVAGAVGLLNVVDLSEI